ncbi:hypothetical protein, partial [Vibrio parahaemolyticus]|uniref:hypothetical protein n=1 Tax=Vibrio parahaemolyticus TaxID=670 RepID=UPI00325A740A
LVPNVLRQRIVDLDGVGVVVLLGRRFNELKQAHLRWVFDYVEFLQVFVFGSLAHDCSVDTF